MRISVLRSQLIDARQHPARVVLTGLAIIIAAFVVFGTVLASDITRRTILDNFSGTPAAVDLVIRDGSLDTMAALRSLPEVAEVAVRTELYLPFADEVNRGLTLISDPGNGPLSTVTVTSGRYPQKDTEIAVSELTAERTGLAEGRSVRVVPAQLTDGPPPDPITLTVVGVVSAADDFGGTAFTTEDAIGLLAPGWEGLPRLDLRLTAGTDAEAARATVTRAVAGTQPEGGAEPVVETGEEVRLAEAKMVDDRVTSLFAIIGLFVAVAVVAAILVAVSTFRIVFAQRMRQLALLRVVGAGRGALQRALVAVGTLVGLLAATTGVLAATALGYLLPPVLGGLGISIAAPEFPVGWAIGVILGAAVITTVAVLAPATTAARVAPLEALRTASTSAGQKGINPARAVVGILLGLGAAMVGALAFTMLSGPDATWYDPSLALLVIVASGTLAYFALVALGPVVFRPVLAVAGWPLRRLGPVGRLAVGGVGAAPRRAAAVSVVVALGVTLVGGALVGSASLRELITRELAGAAPADLNVIAEEALPDGYVERVANLAELERVLPYRSVTELIVEGLGYEVSATDLNLRQLSTWDDFEAAAGNLDDLGPGTVVALTHYADSLGIAPGQALRISRGDQSIELRLVATLGNTPVGAGLLMDPSDLDRLGVGPGPTGLLADVAEGVDRTAAVTALRGISGTGQAIEVLADIRDNLNAELTQIIGVLLSLLSLTVIVALVGVGTTTSLSVVERVREAGLLRAVGLTRAGLRTMLTVEAGLYGLIGSILGLALAVPYSWLTIEALAIAAPIQFPAGQLALVVVVLSIATALA
ncbi:MAG TPA: FtsX-like permease family protein, partial [Micromonosporaceae bacterium]|nr:FtsX-like permease family protein [Micromonosporaceae bacterium]